jgi:hypothetical protein
METDGLLGIIQVPLFAFRSERLGRGLDISAVKRLGRVFRRNTCDPNNPKHHVKGVITKNTYDEILRRLGLTPEEFRSLSHQGKYHKLTLRNCINISDGVQRIAAARKRFGDNYRWAVRLYFKSTIPLTSDLVFVADDCRDAD